MLSSYFDLRARRQAEERQREDYHQAEAHRREDVALWGRHFQDSERRHQEMMALLIASLSNGGIQSKSQGELIRTLQQTIDDLRDENSRLRGQNGNGDATKSP